MINSVFAVNAMGGMGYQGSLPWPNHKEDLQHFKSLTEGHIVVMGKKSWMDSKMPKPLRGREVYVASNIDLPYAKTFTGDIKENVLALEAANPDKIIWVVGGPALIMECAPIIDVAHVTYMSGWHRFDTKMDIDKFLKEFTPACASVSADKKAAFVKYYNKFKRS